MLREVRKAGTDVCVTTESLFDFRCNAICYHAKCRLCKMRTVIYFSYLRFRGPGSSIGIATGYGLDGQGIEPRLGRDFPHLFRTALGPNHPPVQWLSGLSRG